MWTIASWVAGALGLFTTMSYVDASNNRERNGLKHALKKTQMNNTHLQEELDRTRNIVASTT